MKRIKTLTTLLVLVLFTLPAFSQVIPFRDSSWVFNSRAHIIENFMGHNSIYLQGGAAYIADAGFKNGTIEYDVYMTERVAFAGLAFRIASEAQYEHFYTRGHHSTHPDAYQYTPVYNGMAAWQLYHDGFTGNNNGLIGWRPLTEGLGFNGILEFKYDQWVHFKFVIKDQRAEIYIDHEEEPSVVIHQLMIPATEGGIGFFASAGATHFANFQYTKSDDVELKSQPRVFPEVEAGVVMEWEISEPFKEEQAAGATFSDEWMERLKWRTAEADKLGMLNISRFTPSDRKNNTVMMKLEINSDEDQVIPMELGFSDRLKVIQNGKAIFSGNDTFRTRDYRYLGTIGYFDTVYLDLKKGRNTVYFAVSESFGGWGIQGKLPADAGVKVK